MSEKRITVTLPDAVYERIVRLAAEEYRSVSAQGGWIIRSSIDAYEKRITDADHIAAQDAPKQTSRTYSNSIYDSGEMDLESLRDIEEAQKDARIASGGPVIDHGPPLY